MKIKFEFNFKTLWLFIGAVLLALPVFVPSYPDSMIVFGNVMNLSWFVLFIMSFPCSLLGFPLSVLLQTLWNVGPQSIQGLYLQVVSFFVMGFAQWFVVAPRVIKKFSSGKHESTFEDNQTVNSNEKKLPDAFDESGFTPLENVLHDKEEETKIRTRES